MNMNTYIVTVTLKIRAKSPETAESIAMREFDNCDFNWRDHTNNLHAIQSDASMWRYGDVLSA